MEAALAASDLGLAQRRLRLILKIASDVYNTKFGNEKAYLGSLTLEY